jgi:RNA polymerase subunit RPABC4/transcription elongation factor Spt4
MTSNNESVEDRVCPWCSASVSRDAVHCPVCGDALAQRESIDGLAITGVTTVDPELQAYAGQPLHIPLPIPSGSNVPGTMAERAALAAPYGSGLRGGAPVDPGTVGKPSDAALEAARRMDREDPSD